MDVGRSNFVRKMDAAGTALMLAAAAVTFGCSLIELRRRIREERHGGPCPGAGEHRRDGCGCTDGDACLQDGEGGTMSDEDARVEELGDAFSILDMRLEELPLDQFICCDQCG